MNETTARELTRRVRALALEKSTEVTPSPITVPISYYRDRSLWEWECRELLRSAPIVAAPSVQLPRPCDYHVRDLLGRSVLVTRDREGCAHVLLNYCSHRGFRVAEGDGHQRSFACPYHKWTYGLDGRLLGRPRAECFDDRHGAGLVELPSEERFGMIWCLPDPDTSLDLDTHLGPLAPELDYGAYDSCTYLTHRDVEVSANWKAGLENFADFYHVPYIHASTREAHVGDSGAFDRFGLHHRLVTGMSSLVELSPGDVDAIRDDSHLIVAYWIFPSLVLTHQSGTINLIQFQPGGDPGSCVMRLTQLARRPSLSESERRGYDGIVQAISAVILSEDVPALDRAGEGLSKSARSDFLIGSNEPGVQNMIRTFSEVAAGAGVNPATLSCSEIRTTSSGNSITRGRPASDPLSRRVENRGPSRRATIVSMPDVES